MTEEEIYGQLKEAIIAHRLPPGTRLAEEALAEAFGVSRTPMRNVLRRLAYERLVVIERNRGASVCSPTPEDAREVFEMRHILEDAALERAVPRFTAEDVARLRGIDAADTAATARGDYALCLRLAGTFHIELARIAGNGILVRQLSELMDLSYVILALYGPRPEEIVVHAGAHETLLDALDARDAARVRSLLREHLDQIFANLDYSRPARQEIDFKRLFTPGAESGRRAPVARRGSIRP